MSLAAHVTGVVVFAMGCVLGIMSVGHLVRAWRWRPWGPDGTESKHCALGGACMAAWIMLVFGPWLAGWNPAVVLVMTIISLAPLILGIKFIAPGIGHQRGPQE